MKFRTWAAGLAASGAMVCASQSNAGSPVGSWYVSPELLWVSPDNKLNASEETGFRIGVGKAVSEKYDLEAGFAKTEHSAGPQGPVGNLTLVVNDLTLRRVFNRDQRFSTFLDLGLGMVTSRYRQSGVNSVTRPGIKTGLGFTYGPKILQLVGTAGLRFDDVHLGATALDPYAGLGLRVSFGGNKAAPSAVAAAPAAAPVAAPAPPPPPPPPAPVDSDKDGVLDNADRCPNTPVGARVDANGCELDGDKDGVVDRLDRCPTTPAGDKVDEVGCGLTIALEVKFDTNSANIKAESNAELDAFAAFLNAVPSAKGDLEGHTDSVGSDAYNKSLSQRRADSVKAYVVSKGIDGSRLNAVGYGESKPVADNKTAEGRAQNRRVLFTRASLQQ